jgi:tetrahydromethanopterin S-methyltransferase subunit G
MPRMLTIPDDCKEFQAYFDDIQEKISRISVLDDLLAGSTTNISY